MHAGAQSGESDPPLLEMRGISKSFPGVRALKRVDLELRRGEVLAMLGENGAGKSTLIKILAGAHPPDEGSIRMEGRPVLLRRPADAEAAGIAVIYQHFNLVPSLSARENLFLGREPRRAGFLRQRKERREAEAIFRRVGVEIDAEKPCRELTVAQQQVVEIAKALLLNARILIMDEPTAALTPREVERLFEIIRDLRRQGLGIIYVSHRLEEVFELADRVTVLRDGAEVGSLPIGKVTRRELIELMVGRKLEQEFPKREAQIGGPLLVVRNLRREPHVRGVSFEIRSGEVLGLTGLIGAGRTELARLIFGADRCDEGWMELAGRPLRPRDCREAIRAGIGLVTEDRLGQGLLLGQSARENFGLANLREFARWGIVRERREREAFQRYIETLSIRVSDPEQPVRNLSGGNQQKVLLSKWLQRDCEVFLLDEPTRGVDVAAKYEIYQLINRLAARGKAVLLISSELPEVLGMSDRILVMHRGRIVGEFENPAEATQEAILSLAVG